MHNPAFLLIATGLALAAGLVTYLGTRTRRALRNGVSRVGLLIGLLVGGALIVVIDAGAAIAGQSLLAALGFGEVPLLAAFVVIAVAHLWATLALTLREPQPVAEE